MTDHEHKRAEEIRKPLELGHVRREDEKASYVGALPRAAHLELAPLPHRIKDDVRQWVRKQFFGRQIPGLDDRLADEPRDPQPIDGPGRALRQTAREEVPLGDHASPWPHPALVRRRARLEPVPGRLQ